MNKSIKIIFAFLTFMLFSQVFSLAQERVLVVKDEDGNPLPNATVIIGEDGKPISTNENGEFKVTGSTRMPILVEAEGFDSRIVTYSPEGFEAEIVLSKMPFRMGERDAVNLPFVNLKKRQINGAVTTLLPAEILLHDYQDDLGGLLTGRVPGLFGSANVRGIGAPLYVVDGIVRPSATIMNIQEIEQISVVKDLSTAMLYGGQAMNGVIYITTKRGKPLKKSMIFSFEKGMDKPISYPNFLGAADYMTLYNEALANDGIAPKYFDDQIANTRNGIDPIALPDEDYFNSTYLRNWANYQRINAEVSGGNDIAQFFLNVGWDRSNTLLKIGEGSDERNDRMNMRGNIDYKITDKVKLTFDGSVMFNISNAPRYTNASEDFWALASTQRPNDFPVLIPLDLIADETLSEAARPISGGYVFGGTSEYQTNIYGELMSNGSRGSTERYLAMNTGLNFDLSSITQGLTSRVFFSLDMYNQYREELLNSYAIYQPIYDIDGNLTFDKRKNDVKVTAKSLSDASYYRRYGVYGTLDYKRSFGEHDVTATALAYRDENSVEGVVQSTKHLHFGGRVNYMLRNKYVAQFTAVHAGSLKLFEAKKWAFSPGVGLGWILTEEDFLEGNSLIDYFKLRMNWAVLQTDENLDYRLDRDYYTDGSTFEWSRGSYSNDGRNVFSGNPHLEWEKVMNFNAGFESSLIDHRLNFEASYFNNRYYDVITQRINSLPGFLGILPYENFGNYETKGVEIGLNYVATFGGFRAILGGNFTYSVPKVLATDELNHKEDYRRRTGKATDAMMGLTAIGLFQDQADIDNHAFQDFGATIRPGDIKYEDLNGDGIVNDDDMSIIGNSSPRVNFGLNLRLQYKAFELFALGSGQAGEERFFNNSYYWVYGDRKYSESVLDRWTPATAATATYPRLSSSGNANNFRNSTFWLHSTNFFNLHTAQLTYSLPGRDLAGLKQVRIFVRGSNLAMISKEKEKLQLNIGTRPQMRSFSAGLNLMF